MSETEIPSQDSCNTEEENAVMYVPAEDSPLARMIAEENARHQGRHVARRAA